MSNTIKQIEKIYLHLSDFINVNLATLQTNSGSVSINDAEIVFSTFIKEYLSNNAEVDFTNNYIGKLIDVISNIEQYENKQAENLDLNQFNSNNSIRSFSSSKNSAYCASTNVNNQDTNEELQIFNNKNLFVSKDENGTFLIKNYTTLLSNLLEEDEIKLLKEKCALNSGSKNKKNNANTYISPKKEKFSFNVLLTGTHVPFPCDSDETTIASFSCGVMSEFLIIQGRMYVTNKKIGFVSNVNSQNVKIYYLNSSNQISFSNYGQKLYYLRNR